MGFRIQSPHSKSSSSQTSHCYPFPNFKASRCYLHKHPIRMQQVLTRVGKGLFSLWNRQSGCHSLSLQYLWECVKKVFLPCSGYWQELQRVYWCWAGIVKRWWQSINHHLKWPQKDNFANLLLFNFHIHYNHPTTHTATRNGYIPTSVNNGCSFLLLLA